MSSRRPHTLPPRMWERNASTTQYPVCGPAQARPAPVALRPLNDRCRPVRRQATGDDIFRMTVCAEGFSAKNARPIRFRLAYVRVAPNKRGPRPTAPRRPARPRHRKAARRCRRQAARGERSAARSDSRARPRARAAPISLAGRRAAYGAPALAEQAGMIHLAACLHNRAEPCRTYTRCRRPPRC